VPVVVFATMGLAGFLLGRSRRAFAEQELEEAGMQSAGGVAAGAGPPTSPIIASR
jgi:hypothetical protein